jgi:hypothetical protein
MLTQADADVLIAMRKSFVERGAISLAPGVDSTYDLVGDDRQERFLLDLWRGTFRLSKFRFQERARKVIVLVRLDVDGSPHTNPDGLRIGGTHLHRYREGYEDKWAVPLDRALFTNPANAVRTLGEFCAYCNIAAVPAIQDGLL